MINIALVIFSIILGAVAQVCLKLGATHSGVVQGNNILVSVIKYFTNPYILSGVFLYGLSAVLWIFALSKVELSYAYPMFSFGYVLVAIMSYFWLGESMSLLKIGGLGTICLGIIILAKG